MKPKIPNHLSSNVGFQFVQKSTFNARSKISENMLVSVDSHFLLVFSMRIVTVALNPINPYLILTNELA